MTIKSSLSRVMAIIRELGSGSYMNGERELVKSYWIFLNAIKAQGCHLPRLSCVLAHLALLRVQSAGTTILG